MDATGIDAGLNELFGSGNSALPLDVLNELKSICRLHTLSPQEAFYKWESYSIKMGSEETKLSLETVRSFKQDIQDGLARDSRTKPHGKNTDRKPQVSSAPRNAVTSGDVFGMLENLVSNTPKSALANRSGSRKAQQQTPSRTRQSDSGPTPVSTEPRGYTRPTTIDRTPTHHDSATSGQVVESLNASLSISKAPEMPYLESRVKLTANTDVKKFSYRPTAMHLSEASEVLDDRIDEFAELVQIKHNLPESEFGSPASQSTNEIVAVGRICSDSLDGKLNAQSIVLESSRRMGAGLRVPLKVDGLSSFDFFPGQIVAVRGKNPSGTFFAATEILEMPLLPPAASAPSTLDSHAERMRGCPDSMEEEPHPMSVMIASGPYTTDESLDFGALQAFCEEASSTNVDALILLGPFLDIEHPLLSSGDFELPESAEIDSESVGFAAIFKALIAPHLSRLTENNPGVTIMMVPSVRDAISAHVSWPQEPLGASGGFTRRELGLPKQVRLGLSNPMLLSLNEVLIGISSQDIIVQLKREESIRQPKEPNVLARLPRYLIEQRHFFPLFPPEGLGTGFGQSATGASIDTAYLKLGEFLNARPDVLITPSSLPPFAKVVESVVVINPGTLSKKKGPGTYSKLFINLPNISDEDRDTGKAVSHRVYERARVDVVRI